MATGCEVVLVSPSDVVRVLDVGAREVLDSVTTAAVLDDKAVLVISEMANDDVGEVEAAVVTVVAGATAIVEPGQSVN